MASLFEWDPNKDKKNKKKHGISFTEATEVFNDVNRITNVENKHDYGEERLRTVGKVPKGLFDVIWTPRNNRKRLISAHPASKKSKRNYNK